MRVACFAIGATLVWPTVASAETLILYGVGRGSGGAVHQGHGDTPGPHPWNAKLQDESGNDLGTTTGVCLPTDQHGHELCNFIIDQVDVGQMVVTGLRQSPIHVATMIIVGGTGAYLNARGTVTSTPVHDEGQDKSRLPRRWRYDIEFVSGE